MFIQGSNFTNNLILKCGRTDGVHNSGDHLHQNFEFEFVIEGEIEITVDGVKYVAHRGDIAIISPFRVHSFYTPKYVRQIICVFSNQFLTDFLPFRELCKDRETPIFHASEPLWSYIMSSGFCDSIRTRLSFDPEIDANYIHRLKSTFYLILSEYFEKVAATESSRIDNTLSKILIYISENYTSDITLKTVGAALGYSAKYVSGCFKAISGFSFRSFVNSLRIERAKTLLVTTDKKNSEICYECGFVSQASFHRAFKAHVGKSPQKYRAEKNAR